MWDMLCRSQCPRKTAVKATDARVSAAASGTQKGTVNAVKLALPFTLAALVVVAVVVLNETLPNCNSRCFKSGVSFFLSFSFSLSYTHAIVAIVYLRT